MKTQYQKVIAPKVLCLRPKDVEIYVTKNTIEKERWLLLKNYYSLVAITLCNI